MSNSIKYKISASYNFIKIFQNLETSKSPQKHPKEEPDALKVAYFMSEYLNDGWNGNLVGKNVPSDNVPTEDPNWLQKVKYAQQHSLYHYHVGVPFYKPSDNGYYTSEYVVHYQQLNDYHIKLVDLDPHPPLNLPSESMLDGDIDLSETKN